MAGSPEDLSNVIIIDGLPEGVEGDKVSKLTDIVDKVLKKAGHVVTWDLVTDEEGKTKGFAFVEYSNPKEAEGSIAKLQGFKFDKKHVFRLCPFQAWQGLKTVPETFTPDSSLQDRPVENQLYWLLDPAAREQYGIRYANRTEIHWLDPTVLSKSAEEHGRDTWTELHARWSPRGTYFATFHQQGVQLWGGPSWNMLGRFAHPGVALTDFSPKEKFLVTWANTQLQIWDVKNCQPVKSFQGGPTKQHGWPVFKWSADEAFFARIVEDNIHIFDSTTMSLIQPNKSQLTTLYIPGVSGFEWSPTENLLAYWVPESGDKPARVVLLKIQKKANATGDECPIEFVQMTQKNFFLVADIKAHWHDQGDFLGVKVDRMAKKGKDKTKITSFDLFRIRTKGQVAVEMVEIPSDVIAFAWEPKGTRFGVIHKGKNGNNVSFYTMGNPKSGTVKKWTETLEDRPCDHIFWSPKGNHVVLAGLSSQSTSGPLEFYDVQNKESMSQCEHYLCTDLLWDPSGRYVGTCVSSYRYQMENGFKIWTFQGKLVHSVSKEKFWQFMWRPHPPSLLSEERQKKIMKNLKEKASAYEAQQKELDEKEAEQLAAEKNKKRTDFYTFYNGRKEEMQPLTQARRRARRNCDWDSDDEGAWRQVEETYEEVVSVEETLVEA